MIAFAFTLLAAAQTSAPLIHQPPALQPLTLQEDRLRACMTQARRDPPTAITTAVEWMEGTYGGDLSYPQQCLGFAYMSLLRWDSARVAFIAARDSRPETDHAGRARLGGMAGNAALGAEDFAAAAPLLATAQADALAAGDNPLAGQMATDRARALVGLGSNQEAAAVLEQARELAPQEGAIWLLSATLARRMDDLAAAQGWIRTAALLDPQNPAVGLEAGLIAALGGFDDAARSSWQSVLALAPGTAEAMTAQTYLAQLDGEPPAR
ncbi:hypothetical protein GCM10009127_02770 [Alteraurantiacibacter aestuarii]|uniref:Tetratricopeptide repeat protein n=1 Tax=Alteraurantiacibacter aestuarii TaxID=650004 RepID=A0A844ZS93_9SPHN|nr:hypothetical protein [Alteraurantiacibacter aestuarii]MXO88469.1 hypothetical protein [Alteraurantiacibacter aestuarii]